MNRRQRLLARLEHHYDRYPGHYFLAVIVGITILLWGIVYWRAFGP